jgi:hypothetical protein
MRTFVVVSLVFVAGCSLVWNMDPYEDGAGVAPDALEAGASSGAKAGTGDASSTSSSGGSSSGASSGEPTGFPDVDASRLDAATSSGADAGSIDAGGPCQWPEDEPNNRAQDATEIVAGKTCGDITSSTDADWFWVDVMNGPKPITITIESNTEFDVYYPPPAGGGGYADTPGTRTINLPTGENFIIFHPIGAGLPRKYSIVWQ